MTALDVPAPTAGRKKMIVAWSVGGGFVLLLIITGAWLFWRSGSQPALSTVASPTPAATSTTSPTAVSPTPTRPPPTPTALPSPTARPTEPPTATPPPTSTPSRSPTPTPTIDATIQAIRETIWRYSKIKALAVGPTHDASQLDTVLAGEALKEQRKAVRWQRNHGAYYVITVHQLQFERIQLLDATHAQALVRKVETLLYYPEGRTTPSDKASCRQCEYQVLYTLEFINGQWYITEKEVQEQ